MSDDEKAGIKNKISYDQRIAACTVISKPMAGKKETKKLYRLVKKSRGAKVLKTGLKDVVKGIRKNEKGICIIAGDVYPMDVIMHVPVFCEETNIPYIFVPSKNDLGAAASCKRPISCILVTPPRSVEDKELYEEVARICKENEGQVPR